MKNNSKDSRRMLFEMMHKVNPDFKQSNNYICWDAGEGNFEIDKYNPSISWHNDSDVFKGTYDECLKHKEESNENNYRFKNNMPHKSWGNDAPDYR